MTSGTERDQDHEELRPLLLSIAYRMVGSVTEAEDLVQEAYLRYHRSVTAGEVIESPKGVSLRDRDSPGHRPPPLRPSPA